MKKNAIAGHSFAGWSDLDLLCRMAATKQASTLRSDIARQADAGSTRDHLCRGRRLTRVAGTGDPAPRLTTG